MSRESRLWLGAAGAVAVVVAGVVLVFGYTSPPRFPSLYDDGGPTIEASVAYVEYDREDCVFVLDAATGETRELYCDNWVWLESWDGDGNLRIRAGNGDEGAWVVDPDTGAILGTEETGEEPPRRDSSLRSRSVEGRAMLVHSSGETETILIDVEAPRDYGFYRYGITTDAEYAWVCDSEDRLIVVALDGTSGPWLVAEGISNPLWK